MRHSILFNLNSRKNWQNQFFEPGKIYHKTYPRFPRTVLSKPDEISVSIGEVFLGRNSERYFDINEKISLEQLSNLLYWSAGIRPDGKRMYPSGGALYPIEIYPIVFRSDGFDRGVYHYVPLENCLEKIADESWLKEAYDVFTMEEIKTAPVIFVMTAVFERNMAKYQDFGYRLILQETGHIGQNFYLVAKALGLDGCALGAFNDDLTNELLDIDGIGESAVYAFAVGKI